MELNEELTELSEYFSEDQLTEFVLKLINAQFKFMEDTEDIREASKENTFPAHILNC